MAPVRTSKRLQEKREKESKINQVQKPIQKRKKTKVDPDPDFELEISYYQRKKIAAEFGGLIHNRRSSKRIAKFLSGAPGLENTDKGKDKQEKAKPEKTCGPKNSTDCKKTNGRKSRLLNSAEEKITKENQSKQEAASGLMTGLRRSLRNRKPVQEKASEEVIKFIPNTVATKSKKDSSSDKNKEIKQKPAQRSNRSRTKKEEASEKTSPKVAASPSTTNEDSQAGNSTQTELPLISPETNTQNDSDQIQAPNSETTERQASNGEGQQKGQKRPSEIEDLNEQVVSKKQKLAEPEIEIDGADVVPSPDESPEQAEAEINQTAKEPANAAVNGLLKLQILYNEEDDDEEEEMQPLQNAIPCSTKRKRQEEEAEALEAAKKKLKLMPVEIEPTDKPASAPISDETTMEIVTESSFSNLSSEAAPVENGQPQSQIDTSEKQASDPTSYEQRMETDNIEIESSSVIPSSEGTSSENPIHLRVERIGMGFYCKLNSNL